MSATDSLHDLRATFRCPVADSRRGCALLVGEERLPARLVDESAGGFAILLDRPVDLEVGQTALLQTDGGRFNVSIRSITEEPPPEDDNDEETSREWFRIGLQRLGDVILEKPPKASHFVWPTLLRVRKRLPFGDSVAFSGMFLALIAVCVPIGFAMMVWYFQHADDGRNPAETDHRISQSRKKSFKDFLPLESSSSDKRSDEHWWKSVFSDSANGRGTHSQKTELELSGTVRRLPGPTALSMPQVVRRLKLTDEQQKLIQQIIDAMADALRQLDVGPQRGAGRSRLHEQRDKLFDEYLRQAVEVLTPEQKAQWQELRGVETSP